MNKLEKYRNKEAETVYPDYGGLISSVYESADNEIRRPAFEKGFDAAIALDLPVKFSEFTGSIMPEEAKDIVREHYPNYHKMLYQYWLENIYKP